MDEVIKKFTKEEFNTEAPYVFLYQFVNEPFRYMQTYNALEENAKNVGFNKFEKMVSSYDKQFNRKNGGVINNTTFFKDQPLELLTGDWIADDQGITKSNGKGGVSIACVHPIMPVQRLVNIDDGTVRLKLMFRRDHKGWKEIICSKSTLYNAREIKKLADKNISVSDKNAALLVEYLQNTEDLNYDIIPEKQSVSHLGWTSNGLFSPYVKELEFDGIDNFKKIFDSVHSLGSLEEWIDCIKNIRKTDSPARLAIAASFSSPLLKILGKLNYILHLWGGTEVGKTVAELVAISVWGNPNIDGGYLQTFNGTAVGLELLAGFMKNFPLILDEFQLVKDKKNFEHSVYLLCEGIGKTRGAKTGGLQNTPTWKNCSITSGETPITHNASGGGAINRIIEVECKEKLFKDPANILEIIQKNYGHAGKAFVFMLEQDSVKEYAKEVYKNFYKELIGIATEKQCMAAAILLTADTLATKWFLQDNRALKVSDITKYLQTKESVDINISAWDYMYGFIITNSDKFNSESNPCFGVITQTEVRIINNIFYHICEEGGFNSKSLLSWLEQRGKLIQDSRKLKTKLVKIKGKPIRCICISLSEESSQSTMLLDRDDFPFD